MAAVADEIGRVLNEDLDHARPIVPNEIVAPVVLGELDRLGDVLIALRLVVAGLSDPLGEQRVDLRVVPVVLLPVENALDAVVNPNRRAGNVAIARHEGCDCFVRGEVGAQACHVLPGWLLDRQLCESREVLRFFMIHDPVSLVRAPCEGAICHEALVVRD